MSIWVTELLSVNTPSPASFSPFISIGCRCVCGLLVPLVSASRQKLCEQIGTNIYGNVQWFCDNWDFRWQLWHCADVSQTARADHTVDTVLTASVVPANIVFLKLFREIQGVSKRALQLWKRIEIYSTTCMKGIFSYGDSLKIECSYLLCLQMSLNSELELLPQLQKWRQRCYVACGKRLTTGGTSAALPIEVTLNHNYTR